MKYTVHSRHDTKFSKRVVLADGLEVEALIPSAIVEMVSAEGSLTIPLRTASDEEAAAIADIQVGAEVEVTVTVSKAAPPKE